MGTRNLGTRLLLTPLFFVTLYSMLLAQRVSGGGFVSPPPPPAPLVPHSFVPLDSVYMSDNRVRVGNA